MSTTFAVTAQQIIYSALRLQGWSDYTQTPDATKVAQMQEALNIMLKAWAKPGMKIWTIQEIVLAAPTLVQGQAVYAIGPGAADLNTNRPLSIPYAFIRQIVSGNNLDSTLQMLAKTEYEMLGNKQTQGVPNSYFYDALIPNGNLYIYNTPDATTVTGRELHFFSRRTISDINALSDLFDFPQEWFHPLRWGLAAETAEDNQIPEGKAMRIGAKAAELKKLIEDLDEEGDTSVYFKPQLTG